MSDFIDINLYGTNQNDSFFDTDIDLFFQELEIIFQIDMMDVYGRPNVLNLKKYVFSKNVSNYQVSNEIKTYILENCQHATSFPWSIETNFIKQETGTDIMYIKFNIQVGNSTRKREFIINS